jgi:hypothetical protein
LVLPCPRDIDEIADLALVDRDTDRFNSAQEKLFGLYCRIGLSD